MKLRHELRYAATPDAVYTMLADPAFREQVCDAQPVVSRSITITPTESGFDLVNDQVQTTVGLPAVAMKVLGDTTRVTISERWKKKDTGGTVDIVTPGRPMSARGLVTISRDGKPGHTLVVVELDVRVTIPLIGNKLEAVMAQSIHDGLDAEQTVGTAWLSGTSTKDREAGP